MAMMWMALAAPCLLEHMGHLTAVVVAASPDHDLTESESTDNNIDTFLLETFERHLEDEGNDEETGPYVYSKMATIAPDPLLQYGTDEQQEQRRSGLEATFGRWHFWDGEEDIRPSKSDYAADYTYRDIPGEFFSDDAWQADAVFINHILNDGDKMVARTLEALFTEYGRGKPLPPEGYAQRTEMFRMEQINLASATSPPDDYVPKTGKRSKGGWSTSRSLSGLTRRLLHAMMTNDEFVVVLGGDAASAGHGNHFRQSYLMHFHRIFAPMMARMGVKLVTRNLAMGHGMGTIQSTLGFSSLFGQDIDVLIWDGETTEANAQYANLFFRQGLLSRGKQGKVPFLLLGGNSNPPGLFDLLRFFHNEADIDVGQMGTALHGVPMTTSAAQAQTLPEPFRFVQCDGGTQSLCKQNKHCFRCWIDREDITKPKEMFPHLVEENAVGAEGSRWWYPGWREHQLLGRNLAYMLIDSMQDALSTWSQGTMGGPPLEDEEWHVKDMYENMHTKLAAVLSQSDKEVNRQCLDFATEFSLPSRICSVPLKGATEHTPRPNATSLTNLIHVESGADKDTLVPSNPKKMEYSGEDVQNICLDPGSTVVEVAGLRKRHLMVSEPLLQENHDDTDVNDELSLSYFSQTQSNRLNLTMLPLFEAIHAARIERIAIERDQNQQRRAYPASRHLSETYTQGKGWSIHSEKPGQCDGEYLSICGRDSSDSCPLLGYHDSRGELVGNDACGWLVLDLPDLKEGIIIINYAFYNMPSASGKNDRNLRSDHTNRELGSVIPDDEGFALVFSIDGNTETTWTKQDIVDRTKSHHKGRSETLVLLDSAEFTSESKAVRLAIKVNGCGGNSCIFALSHVYWA